MKDTIDEIKKDFMSWSGFELTEDNRDDIMARIKSIQWTLECEIDAQADAFRNRIDKLYPEE